MASSPPTKKLKVVTQKKCDSKLTELFHGLHACIVEQGLGKSRCNILQRQFIKHGGEVSNAIKSTTSHVIISKGVKKEKLLKILKVKELNDIMTVVNADWLSACLVKGELVEESPYLVYNIDEDGTTSKEESGNSSFAGDAKQKSLDERNLSPEKSSYHQLLASKQEKQGENDSDSSYDESMEDIKVPILSASKPVGRWACAKASSSVGENHNTFITDKLAVLEKAYTSTQDRWRALGYKKAIASIKNYHKPLETFEEVSQLPFIGERLAQKIWEIIETGHLRRLDHIDPKIELINKFAAVWGAGPKTAEQWIAQGYKSLDDLRVKANLNFQQKIGLKYYDDINEKMPRAEVSEIEQRIREVAEQLLPGVEMVVCGSYRRGRAMCGDIDVLVSHPDGKSHTGFLVILLEKLKEVKLITDDLITVDNQEQRKYMGMCRLSHEGSKFRRIDFIVAPYSEWPLALMHFTGSAHFNRSIRLLAKKKNMSLSEHALRKDVVYGTGDEKIYKGNVVPVFSEEDVFRYFGLDYLEPTDRDW